MTTQNSNSTIYESTIRLLILLLIIVWCLLIIYPFVNIVLWSFILAMALFPLHNGLAKKLGNKPKLASFILVFSILTLILLPASLLIDSLIEEVMELKTAFDEGRLTISAPNEKVKELPLIGNKIFDLWSAFANNFEQTLLKYNDQITNAVSKIVKGILGAASGVIQIIFSLIIAGILLVINGASESSRKLFRKLAGDKGDEMTEIVTKTVNNVVKGVLGVALILAILHAIILIIAGVPYAGIWTLLIFVLAVLQLPVIIVTVPIIVYIFSTHELVPSIVWALLIVIAGLSDNVLKPLLLGKGAPVPMLVIFIGVIGGFMLSGFLGLFTGAIVMSIGYKLFEEWLNSDNKKSNIE